MSKLDRIMLITLLALHNFTTRHCNVNDCLLETPNQPQYSSTIMLYTCFHYRNDSDEPYESFTNSLNRNEKTVPLKNMIRLLFYCLLYHFSAPSSINGVLLTVEAKEVYLESWFTPRCRVATVSGDAMMLLLFLQHSGLDSCCRWLGRILFF